MTLRTGILPGHRLICRVLRCGVGITSEPGGYPRRVPTKPRCARLADVHDLAVAMPHVTVEYGPAENPIYQVGAKSFVFFRTPRPDAVDPETGDRYPDVIVFWVPGESDKQALVQDPDSPFFTTPHFRGHPSVLLRSARLPELTLQELTEIIQDAWLSRASATRARAWLAAHPRPGD